MKDTEIIVRSLLHRMGYRFRLGGCGLSGEPNIVLSRHNAVVVVRGCTQSGHGCRATKIPLKSKRQIWLNKLIREVKNDGVALYHLQASGYRVCIVWECETKNVLTLARQLNVFLCGRYIPVENFARKTKIIKLDKRFQMEGC